MRRVLTVTSESWSLAAAFTIARGSKTEANVVVAAVEQDGVTGRGECVPYGRYGETPHSVMDAIGAAAAFIERGMTRDALQTAMPAGAARNALDCALWDLEAKSSRVRAWDSAGVAASAPVVTAYTISLASPEAMAEVAARERSRPLLKVKLGAEGDADRIRAVRAAAPQCTLIVDANEGWSERHLAVNIAACSDAGVVLIEQPLPAGAEAALGKVNEADRKGILICADESVHTRHDLAHAVRFYDAINIKLDKAGGLTEALALQRYAVSHGLKIMVGCMAGTSLAMAPALILAQAADFVDLDGPLLLKRDRFPGLHFEGSNIFPADPELWG